MKAALKNLVCIIHMYYIIIVFIIHEHVSSSITFCSLEVGNFVAKVENVVGVYVTLIFVLELKVAFIIIVKCSKWKKK